MRFHREIFFDRFRQQFGKLLQSQVDGLNFLLDKLEKDTFTLEQTAYVLATVKHETAQTFQPIKEYRARAGTKLRKTQDRYWLSGFYGRGFVMITWEDNYRKFGIADSPDKALEPETAYDILSRGMRKGMFTKFKLADFVNDNEIDYHNARKVVNGLDKAGEIANIAEKFEEVLAAASVTENVTEDIKEAAKAEAEAELQKKVPEEPEIKSQEPEPPAAPQAPKPEVTPVEAPPTSITTKVAAGVSAIAPVLTAAGIKIGGIELSTAGVVALSAVVIVGMVLAAWIYNSSQERRERRQRLTMEHLASDTKGNIVAAGTKV